MNISFFPPFVIKHNCKVIDNFIIEKFEDLSNWKTWYAHCKTWCSLHISRFTSDISSVMMNVRGEGSDEEKTADSI